MGGSQQLPQVVRRTERRHDVSSPGLLNEGGVALVVKGVKTGASRWLAGLAGVRQVLTADCMGTGLRPEAL